MSRKFKAGDRAVFYRSMTGRNGVREGYLNTVVTLVKDEGSHYAEGGEQNWTTKEIKFYVVGNLELRFLTKLDKALK